MKSSLGKKGRSQSAIGALECGCFDRKELGVVLDIMGEKVNHNLFTKDCERGRNLGSREKFKVFLSMKM
jgi:hypothetical protein